MSDHKLAGEDAFESVNLKLMLREPEKRSPFPSELTLSDGVRHKECHFVAKAQKRPYSCLICWHRKVRESRESIWVRFDPLV